MLAAVIRIWGYFHVMVLRELRGVSTAHDTRSSVSLHTRVPVFSIELANRVVGGQISRDTPRNFSQHIVLEALTHTYRSR
jgi:hypothetical protein